MLQPRASPRDRRSREPWGGQRHPRQAAGARGHPEVAQAGGLGGVGCPARCNPAAPVLNTRAERTQSRGGGEHGGQQGKRAPRRASRQPPAEPPHHLLCRSGRPGSGSAGCSPRIARRDLPLPRLAAGAGKRVGTTCPFPALPAPRICPGRGTKHRLPPHVCSRRSHRRALGHPTERSKPARGARGGAAEGEAEDRGDGSRRCGAVQQHPGGRRGRQRGAGRAPYLATRAG